jgi:prephenate dehydrogenase
MQKDVMTVGIIGLGSFGAFMAGLIPDSVRVIGYDTDVQKQVTGVENVLLEEIAQADIIVLAVPLQILPKILEQLKGNLRPETLLIDVCSVKVKPQQMYADSLPEHANLLLTHPLFGPQSAATGTKDHRLIVTKQSGALAAKAVEFCRQKLELDVHEMTADEHDRIMARVHALTFFVARGLGDMRLTDELFMTPSYKMLMDLVRLDSSHSEELFRTVERGNPYARAERERFVASLAQIEASLQ